MKREYKLYLEDISKSISKIEKYIGENEFDDFKKKEIVVDAVLNNLILIGEASSQIQEEIKIKYNSIPWREIIDFRNVAIHKYHSINLSRIWNIIEDKIPPLKSEIKKILDKEK